MTELPDGDLRLFDRSRWLPLSGVVVVMTVVAVEAMAVATVMPTVARSLHGLHYYSWAFTAYLLADVIGMVDAGRRTDRQGPGPALLGGLVLFAAGLVVASAAGDIAVFLVGRVLQGLGGGSIIVALYVLVARAFPDVLRPRVFALLSTAWVVPALVGPALAGLVTAAVGWRWVFAGIAPLAIGGTVLLLPVLRGLAPREGVRTDRHDPPTACCSRLRSAWFSSPYRSSTGAAFRWRLRGWLSAHDHCAACSRQARCGSRPAFRRWWR